MTDQSKPLVTCPVCGRRTHPQRMNCEHCRWSLGPKLIEKGAGAAPNMPGGTLDREAI